jgi:hypothetical protein
MKKKYEFTGETINLNGPNPKKDPSNL